MCVLGGWGEAGMRSGYVTGAYTSVLPWQSQVSVFDTTHPLRPPVGLMTLHTHF